VACCVVVRDARRNNAIRFAIITRTLRAAQALVRAAARTQEAAAA
jgi:hypothetical protein